MAKVLAALTCLTFATSLPAAEAATNTTVLHLPQQPSAFTIEAPPVKGLYPGAVKPMELVVVNPSRRDVRIDSLVGTVRRTNRPGCAPVADNLVVRPHAGLPLVVPAGRRKAAGSLALYMPNTVVDACQGATFTIRLTGSGEVRR